MSVIKKKIIVEVAPITKLPLFRSQSFSYLADEKNHPGTLVSIPLFRRKVEGIILSHKPDFERLGNIELKRVSAVVEKSFLTEKQLALAEFISNYYYSPLGIILKSFLPKRSVLRVSKKEIPLKEKNPLKEKIFFTSEQNDVLNKIAKQKNYFRCLLYGPSGAGKTEIYIEAIKQKCSRKQALILVPEVTLLSQAKERYSCHFSPDEIAVISSRISAGNYYDSWKKIKSGKVRIVIGTRMAVFAPFHNLGLVIVDEEQDASYKQWDMSPRYDARTVAEELAKLHQCGIIFGSSTPRPESYHQTEVEKSLLLKLPHLHIPKSLKKNYSLPQIEIVDMRKERWKSGFSGKIINASPLSRKLQSEIAYALKNKLQTILFINRQGLSNFSLCTACKNILRCQKCQSALIYNNNGNYRCSHCSFQSSITIKCEQCGSLEFKNLGLGTQKIEREVLQLFPQARVARLDNETAKKSGFQEKIYQEFSAQKIDILIGTQMATKGWDLPNMALVGIIDADNLLSLPDFSSQNTAFQHILQVSGRTNRPHSKWRGMVVVQTYHPQQEIFRFIENQDVVGFLRKELEQRKMLHYPPFRKIFKLLFQNYDREKTILETKRVFEKLQSIAEMKNFFLSEPHNCFISNIRGRYRRQIIIKLENHSQEEMLKKTILELPAGWIIDVDPLSII